LSILDWGSFSPEKAMRGDVPLLSCIDAELPITHEVLEQHSRPLLEVRANKINNGHCVIQWQRQVPAHKKVEIHVDPVAEKSSRLNRRRTSRRSAKPPLCRFRARDIDSALRCFQRGLK
jgi:hypothetical protein